MVCLFFELVKFGKIMISMWIERSGQIGWTHSIPSTTSSVDHLFSVLKRINNYCRCTQSEERMSGLSLICKEKEMLQNLRLKASFYDLVIEKFVCKERRLELIYKWNIMYRTSAIFSHIHGALFSRKIRVKIVTRSLFEIKSVSIERLSTLVCCSLCHVLKTLAYN